VGNGSLCVKYAVRFFFKLLMVDISILKFLFQGDWPRIYSVSWPCLL